MYMINPISANYSYRNINFTSKDPKIREADDIARKVNKAYPRSSQSIIYDYPNSYKFPNVVKRYTNKMLDLRNEQSNLSYDFYSNEDDVLEDLKIQPFLVKKYRLGNCQESAELSALAAKINGITDFHLAYLDSTETGDLDHAVLLVNPDKKPYIIDSWLGFADYVPKAIERYKSEYGYHFDLDGSDAEKIEVDPVPSSQVNKIKFVSQKKLQEAFPDLMLPKTKKESEAPSLKDKIKNFFGIGHNEHLDVKA